MNSGNSRNKKSLKPSSDRHLVAEQPGNFIFMIGLGVAIVMGYTLSSLFSPGRVTQKIRDAASHISRDLKVDFRTAEMSFRNGVFPRLSVVISDIRMESQKKCWGAPEVLIDQIILPLSVTGLLSGSAPIPKIYASRVQLRLRENFQDCAVEEAKAQGNKEKSLLAQSTMKTSTSSPKTTASLVRLQPRDPMPSQETDVQELHMDQLQITSDLLPLVRTEFLNVKAQVVSSQPRILEVKAQTHLLKNSQVGDYLSHANIFLEYRESPTAKIQTHFFGNWREGHYSLIANYSLEEQMLTIESDLRHIPLSQILEVFKRYRLTDLDLDARQIWVSGQTQFVSDIEELKISPWIIRDFKLEGELGEISLAPVRINSLDPLSYEPLDLTIQNLKVESLLAFLKRPSKSPVFGELGSFSGRGQIISAEKVSLTGEHQGLEFVFSNKGQQEVQILTRIVGDVAFDKNQWNFQVNRVDPENGVLVGGLRLQADRDFKNVKINTKIDELSLSTKVQKLMTNGGDLGPISLDTDLAIEKGSLKSLKGILQVSQMNVEGIFSLKSNFYFKLMPEALSFRFSNKHIVIDPQSPAMALFAPVVQQVGIDGSQPLRVDHFLGDFQISSKRDFSWKRTQGRLNTNVNFSTEGAWNSAGQLQGHLQVKENSKARLNGLWSILGTRDQPILKSQTNSTRSQ